MQVARLSCRECHADSVVSMSPDARPIVAILRFIASRPAGQSLRGADIPGLEAEGGQSCIAWLAHSGLIDASVSEYDCTIRGITEHGAAILARAQR